MIVDFNIKGKLEKDIILIHDGTGFISIKKDDFLKPLNKRVTELESRDQIYKNIIEKQNKRIEKYEEMFKQFLEIFGGAKL